MTDRIPLDDLTSDALDAIYDERDSLAAALADMTRKHNEWQWRAEDAQRQTRCQRDRAAQAETERDRYVLNAEDRARRIGILDADRKRLIAELAAQEAETMRQLDRAGQAEAAIERVRALHYQQDGAYCATCTQDFGRLCADWPCPTIRALDEPKES